MSQAKWLNGIRFKLLMMAAFPLLLFGVLSWTSITNLKSSEESLEKASLVRLPLAQASGEMQSNLQSVMRYLWAARGTSDPTLRNTYLDRYKSSWQGFETALASYMKLPRSPSAIEKWRAVDEALPKLREALVGNYELLKQNRPETDATFTHIMLTQMRAHLDPIEKTMEELDRFRVQASAEETAEVLAASARAVMMVVLISVFGAVTLIAAGLTLATRLANQLGKVTDQVAGSSREVSSASEQLAAASNQLSSASQEQASSLEEASASLQEIAGMVESNEKNAESSVRMAESAHTSSESAENSVNDLVLSMDQILESNRRIEKLVKLIEEIGEKTELIDEIVFQTKLLSFNASVEAERAGEHGRGFAVVAQEVGNLAQMSGKSAIEIASIVKGAIKEAQEVAQENRERVDRSVTLGKSSAESMKVVKTAAKNIVESVQQILRASQEQTTGIRQITTSVEALNKATQENAATSEEAAASGEEMATQAVRLNELVGVLYEIVEGRRGESESVHAHRGSGASVARPRPALKVIPGNASTASNSKSFARASGENFAPQASGDGAARAWEEL